MKPPVNMNLVSTTKAMILKAVDGDKVSFDKFVLRYQDKVANFFFKNLGNRERSLELTQEAFIRFYTYLSRYNSKYRPYTLLFRIARNLCYDEFRSKKREDHFFKTMQRKLWTKKTETIQKEISSDINDSLRSLPDNQRMAVILKFYSGLTSKEIAGVLGTSENNVKVLIFRGCEKLGKLLKDKI